MPTVTSKYRLLGKREFPLDNLIMSKYLRFIFNDNCVHKALNEVVN